MDLVLYITQNTVKTKKTQPFKPYVDWVEIQFRVMEYFRRFGIISEKGHIR